jgi:integrase/recombinase XerD
VLVLGPAHCASSPTRRESSRAADHPLPALSCARPPAASGAGLLPGLVSVFVAGSASRLAGPVVAAVSGVSVRAGMSAESALVLAPLSAEPLVAAVLATLTSGKTKEAYGRALREFFTWTAARAEPLSKALLETWRAEQLARGLAVSSVNQRLSAVRLLLRQAADQGALSAEQMLRLTRVANVRQAGTRLGTWLTEKEAGQLLAVPDPHTRLGQRNRAILALLLACGLRRDELVRLEIRHLQRREEHWVLLDLEGKGRRLRTVPVPLWVKRLLDVWLTAAGIQSGSVFRALRKGDKLGPPAPLSEDAIYTLIRQCGAAIGQPDLTPHDLRRTCAKLCRKAGGELEQIQLLLGHASIQTTQRYLGTQQDLVQAVNDRVNIRLDSD